MVTAVSIKKIILHAKTHWRIRRSWQFWFLPIFEFLLLRVHGKPSQPVLYSDRDVRDRVFLLRKRIVFLATI